MTTRFDPDAVISPSADETTLDVVHELAALAPRATILTPHETERGVKIGRARILRRAKRHPRTCIVAAVELVAPGEPPHTQAFVGLSRGAGIGHVHRFAEWTWNAIADGLDQLLDDEDAA